MGYSPLSCVWVAAITRWTATAPDGLRDMYDQPISHVERPTNPRNALRTTNAVRPPANLSYSGHCMRIATTAKTVRVDAKSRTPKPLNYGTATSFHHDSKTLENYLVARVARVTHTLPPEIMKKHVLNTTNAHKSEYLEEIPDPQERLHSKE